MTDTSTEVKEQKDIIQGEKSKRSKYKVRDLILNCAVLYDHQWLWCNWQGMGLSNKKSSVRSTADHGGGRKGI